MGKLWGAAILAALLLAGCSDPEPGRPLAGPTTTATTTTTATSRPKPIDMRTVDPCVLLYGLHPADLGLDLPGKATPDKSYAFPGSKLCFDFGLKAGMGLGVTPAVNEGFDSYVDGVRATVTRADVAGYRFAVVRPANPDACFGVVDVNDGQLLYLATQAGALEPKVPQDTLCALLPRIAEAAMRVLTR